MRSSRRVAVAWGLLAALAFGASAPACGTDAEATGAKPSAGVSTGFKPSANCPDPTKSTGLRTPCYVANFRPKAWVLGDSISAGSTYPAWRYAFYTAYAGRINMVGTLFQGGTPDIMPGQEFHDAIGGLSTAQMIVAVLPRQTTVQPDIVLCMQGINDIVGGADAATVLSRLSTAYDIIWATGSPSKPWLQIVAIAMLKPLIPAYDAVVVQVNAGLPALIASKPYSAHITFISGTYNSIQPQTISFGAYADEIHPYSPGGYLQFVVPVIAGTKAAIQRARPYRIVN